MPPSCSIASPTMRTTSSSLGDVALHEHVADALAAHLVHAGVDLFLGVVGLARARAGS